MWMPYAALSPEHRHIREGCQLEYESLDGSGKHGGCLESIQDVPEHDRAAQDNDISQGADG